MKIYQYDAFEDPVEHANGKPRPMAADILPLHCGGMYDPALALHYLPARPHGQPIGLFTTLDNHEGQVQNPAALAKLLYAGQAPIDCIDPV